MSTDTELQLHRDLGRMDEKLAAHERRLQKVERMVEDIHKAVTEAKGGWRMLVIIGSVSATVGAAVAKLFAYIKGG